MPDDLLKLIEQYYDKKNISSIGEVIISKQFQIISPNAVNSINNALNSESTGSESTGIYLLSGTYTVDTNLINKSNNVKKIVAIRGQIRIVRS